MAANGGALLERRSSVRRSQSMVLEEDRGPPADEELMFRSQGSNEQPSGAPLKIGAVLDRDSAEPKSRLAKEGGDHGGGPSGK